MAIHIFGSILTSNGCAANNRGETEGNITTLQKILWKNNVHTTVSAEAIRWGLRYNWQQKNCEVNRKWDEQSNTYQWQDSSWKGWQNDTEKTFIDDDLLGFMKAEGAKEENKKGSANVRRGVLEVSRAVSLTPYAGDISFNSKGGTKDRTSLYGTEIHCTRYQYGFAMTPERLKEKSRCIDALSAICSLTQVGGNQSRFLFDFSPESIVFRISNDPAPRVLYCFEDLDGKISIDSLIFKIEAGDIPKQELYIGGQIAEEFKSQNKEDFGCLEKGVKKANDIVCNVLKTKLEINGDKN